MKLISDSGMLQMLHEVGPARVGLELAVAGLVVELARAALSVGMPASRPRAILIAGKVERQAEQVVAQRLGDELVDLVADLARDAAHDGAGGLFRCRRRSPRTPAG